VLVSAGGIQYRAYYPSGNNWSGIIVRIKKDNGVFQSIISNNQIVSGLDYETVFPLETTGTGGLTHQFQKTVEVQFAVVKIGSYFPGAAPSNSITYNAGKFGYNQVFSKFKNSGNYSKTLSSPNPGVSTEVLGLPVKYEKYRACSYTPSVLDGSGNTIALNDVNPSELGSVGSTAKQKNFRLRFSGCSGVSLVTYWVQSTASSPNSSQGLLGQTGSAGGVAIQVLRRGNTNQYAPISLNTSYTLNKSVGSSTAEQYFSVRYYRTGSLSPGNVAGQMKVFVEYS